MGNDQHLDEVKQALKQVLCEEPTVSSKEEMETLVDMFFKEVVSKYTPAELRIKLSTPETTIEQFQHYLAGQK